MRKKAGLVRIEPHLLSSGKDYERSVLRADTLRRMNPGLAVRSFDRSIKVDGEILDFRVIVIRERES